MSTVWTVLMLLSLSVLVFTNPSLAVNAMTAGAGEAVSLALKLVATYGLWMGFFSLLEKLNVTEKLARIMKPVVRFLFPSANERAEKFVTMNISANLLGLGNAATPMGINAVCALDKDGKMNDDLAMFLVISATSLQLLPTTVISMRAQAGSVAPTAILLPCIVATVTSTVLGIAICKTISGLKNRRLKANKPDLLAGKKNK